MSAVVEQPGPVGVTVADLLCGLPREAVLEIERLLSHRLAHPSIGTLRAARLGLLMDLVSHGSGEVPGTADYEHAREERAAAGEHWPSSADLSRAYAGWLGAVRAAMALCFDCRPHVPVDIRPWQRAPAQYTREETLDAMDAFVAAHCVWPPTATVFYTWRALRIRHARAAGAEDPRVPSAGPIDRIFGGYPAYLTAAKTRARRRKRRS